MIKGLYNASKSMNDKIHNIQIVANNLANLSTNGFKREIPFAEYMERAENEGVKQVTDFSEGEFLETDNPLDFAISGKAFFAVNTERGIELTKNGQFEIDEEGYLTTKDGNKVLGEKGNINLDESLLKSKGEITVTDDGQIKVGKFFIDYFLSALFVVMAGRRLRLGFLCYTTILNLYYIKKKRCSSSTVDKYKFNGLSLNIE